jgi:GAF domain-containing protein
MLRAKASGKNQVVVFDASTPGLPYVSSRSRRQQDLRSVAHLKLLQTLAAKISRLDEVEVIGKAIVEELSALVDYHACRVYVAHDDLLVPIALRGDHEAYRDETVEALIVRVGEGITGMAAATAEPILVHDAARCEFAVDVPGSEPIEESMVAVPLVHGTATVGVIVISKLGLRQFDESDVRLLEVLAGHASVAIENARLQATVRDQAERLEHDLLSTVEALARAAAPSDAREVAELAMVLGRGLGMAADELRRLELAALLRQVDDRLVARIGRLAEARRILHQSYERWDVGTEAIPLASRVVAVVGAYEDMTSPTRMTPASDREARQRLRDGAGTEFDPGVVDTFLALLDRSGQLRLLVGQ